MRASIFKGKRRPASPAGMGQIQIIFSKRLQTKPTHLFPQDIPAHSLYMYPARPAGGRNAYSSSVSLSSTAVSFL